MILKYRWSAAAILTLSIVSTRVAPIWAEDMKAEPIPAQVCEYMANRGVHEVQRAFEYDYPILDPEDAIAWWKQVLSSVVRGVKSWRDYSDVDYALPLLKIRGQFSKGQVDRLMHILSLLKEKDNYWEDMVWPVEILFFPTRYRNYYEFENSITQYSSRSKGTKFSSYFNYATVTALKNLPEDKHLRMRKFFYDKIMIFRNDPPLNKFTRRNAELFYRALHENQFQSMLSGLVGHSENGRLDSKIAAQQIDRFWLELGFAPKFEFADVLAVATLIQKGPLRSFLGNGWIYLYGSFTNGGAQFPQSDIDLHLSPALEQLHEDMFGYEGTFAKPEASKTGPRVELLQTQFFDLERLIARELGVRKKFLVLSGYTPGKFLSVSSGRALFAPEDWFTPKYMSIESPLMVRITKDRIFLQVYDAFHSRRLFEVELQ